MRNRSEQRWLQDLAEAARRGELGRRSFLQLAASAGLSLSAAATLLGTTAAEARELQLKDTGFQLPKHNYLMDKESPFEIKNVLIDKAQKAAAAKSIAFINVGRGNPNFLNPTVRQAFAQLVLFAAEEAGAQNPAADFGYRVPKDGLAAKLRAWLKQQADAPGAAFLGQAFEKCRAISGIEEDELAFQMVDAANGDFYPDPSRILPFNEAAVTAYQEKILFGGKPPRGKFHLFATEGATAAMVYVFGSLKALKVLREGDKVAIFTPIFSPYLEMPRLSEFGLQEVHIAASEANNWHVDPAKVREALKDTTIKALFLVNPANPGAVALTREVVEAVAEVVRDHNPELIVINDTVYASFVEEYHTLAELIPENTIGCYSFSKYFGVTGWRLGTISLYETCVVDKIMAKLPEADKKALRARYDIVSTDPDKLPYYQRVMMESRDIALAHTGGLSCPQQVIMALFSLFEILDSESRYKKTVTGEIKARWDALYKALGLPPRQGAALTRYYAVIDLRQLAETRHGKAFATWLDKQWDLGFLFHLAEDTATVCLPGDGFAGPKWSIRIATANQSKENCDTAGRNVVSVIDEYHADWKRG